MKRTEKQKMISIIVTVCMMIGMFGGMSTVARAATIYKPTAWDTNFTLNDGDTLDLTNADLATDAGSKIIKVSGNVSATIMGDVSKTFNNLAIEISGGAKLTIQNLKIDNSSWNGGESPILSTDSNSGNMLILSGVNEVKGCKSNGSPGVHVGGANALIITANSTNDKMVATGGNYGIGWQGGAGIGGGTNEAVGTITISGGTVTAKGGDYGAGIGSGLSGTGGNITISGGNITATGGYTGSGIGCGCKGAGGTIAISGGSITATGGYYASGIRGGSSGAAGTVTIKNSATLMAVSDGALPAIQADGTNGALAAGSDASVLMANFSSPQTGNISLYNKEDSSLYVGYTPSVSNYLSIAFTVPGNKTYQLKTGGNLQQHDSGTPSSDFVIGATGGLNIFNNVKTYVTPTMIGSVTISGAVKFGQTLTANTTGLTNGGTVKYQWNRDGASISGATNATYVLAAEDIGKSITVTVSADGVAGTGAITSGGTTAVGKADGPAAPAAAPVMISKTQTSVTLTANSLYEFSKDDGATWQDSEVFSGLAPSTAYIFVSRVKATATTNTSVASTELSLTTMAPEGGSNKPIAWTDFTLNDGDTLDLTDAGLAQDAGGKKIILNGSKSAKIIGDTNKIFIRLAIEISGGAKLTIENLKIDNSSWTGGKSPVSATDSNPGNTLILSGVNEVKGCNSNGSAGVHVGGTNALIITANSTNDKLAATGGFVSVIIGGAGIGGSATEAGGNITISGGVVTATVGEYGAGIGGGQNGAGGNITISGGVVTATGGNMGAGIGGGSYGAAGTIMLNGGDITAIGNSGAGIGGGCKGAAGTITIKNAATLKSSSQMSTPAIQADGTNGALALGSTAKVLMANYSSSRPKNTDTSVYAKDNPSACAEFTPSKPYQSIAFTVPGDNTYQLKTGGKLQQQGSGTPSLDFAIGDSDGLKIFSNVTTYTPPNMIGTVTITGTAKFGQILTANATGLTNGGTVTYNWNRGGVSISGATNSTYILAADDIGKVITVTVTADGVTGKGTITSGVTAVVGKADIVPTAPVMVSKTQTSVTLTANSIYEFSKDNGATWQDSEVFTGLTPSTAYTFVTRVKATLTTNASAVTSVSITTDAAPYVPPTPIPTAPTTAPVIPVTAPAENPVTRVEVPKEQVTIDVTDTKSDNPVSVAVVERETQKDGTKKDSIKFEEKNASEAVDKLKEQGKDTARIMIPDKKDEVIETKVDLPKSTISTLGQGNINLEISTEDARINIPKETLIDLAKENTDDVYFRVVPIKSEQQRNEVIERTSNSSVVMQVVGEGKISVIARPMMIETNMSEKPVDVILPLKDVVIPIAESEREAFLSKLAVYVEHHDGTKELIRGEVVAYGNGVLGIKFRITKFSTFTIIKLDIPEKSKDCEVTSWAQPKDVLVKGTTVTKTVGNGITSVKVELTVSDKATYKLYSDEGCKTEIPAEEMQLEVGANTAYVKVTAEDGTTKTYAITITRQAAPLSKLCGVKSFEEPKDVVVNGTSITKTVGNKTTSVKVVLAVSDKATYKLYADKEFKAEIANANDEMQLNVGENRVYVKVTAEDGTTKTYVITITRQALPISNTNKVPINTKPESLPAKQESNKEKHITKVVKTKKVIFLATKNSFTDAYAGEVLAKKIGGKVIQIGNDEKDHQIIVKYVTRNLTSKDTIYVFGLKLALKNQVDEVLKAKGYRNIIRIGGVDKYETAEKIAEKLNPKKGTTVVLINGDKAPRDGANVRNLCAKKGYPILFVEKDKLTKYTLSALKNIKPSKIYLVGDSSQISERAENELLKGLKIKQVNIVRVKTSRDIKK